ncbi:sulfatase family protein [Tamlana crocina]|nr:sulfatase [Tamlana crocina]
MQKKLFVLIITTLYLSCKTSEKTISEEKPLNILFILTDDQGAHLSAVGTKGISTPNIDALAKNGVLFTKSFAVVPSCSPSRSSIMTGMYPHANGHWRNTITPRLDEPVSEFGRQSKTVDKVGIHEYLKTLPELLQEHGYFTGITQKFHMSPPWKFPYSDRNPVNNDPDQFKNVISQYIASAGDKPFFIQANIAPPHRNFDHHMDKFSEFLPNPEDIEVPEYLADTPEMRKDLAKYYGSVQLADACAGSIISALKEKNLLESTIIIYTSDQGEPYHRAKASAYYAGLHVPFVASGPSIVKNKISDALISHIDIMPTILDYANIDIPSSVQGKSLKSLLNGKQEKLSNRDYIFGEHNSHGPIRAEHYPSRAVFDGRYYYIKNLMHSKTYELPADLKVEKGWGNHSYQATLKAKESHPVQYSLLKQLESGRPKEELYDMKNDFGQINNLVNNPEYKEKLKELREAINAWRKETGDLENDPLNIKTRQLNK